MALEEQLLTGLALRDCMSKAYAVGQSIQVCLEFDMTPAQGVRFVVATFVNERGDVAELIDIPSGDRSASCRSPSRPACRVEQPTQALRTEAVTGGASGGWTHVDPPGISFE